MGNEFDPIQRVDEALIQILGERSSSTKLLDCVAQRWKATGLRNNDLIRTLDRLEARAMVRVDRPDDDISVALTPRGVLRLSQCLDVPARPAGDSCRALIEALSGRTRSNGERTGVLRRATDAPAEAGAA